MAAASPAFGHPHHPALAALARGGVAGGKWADPARPDVCNWDGVACEDVPGRSYPQVVSIHVPCEAAPAATAATAAAAATLPTELGLIDTLRDLTAYDCGIGGTVPTELAGLPHLRKVLLGYNALTGTLPPQGFASNDLTGLWLEHNELRGAVPSRFGAADQENEEGGSSGNPLAPLGGGSSSGRRTRSQSALVTLSLTSNHFTGGLPDALAGLESLQVLEVAHNDLSGTVPSWLSHLDFAELAHNRFQGPMPRGVCHAMGGNLERHVLEGNADLKGCDGIGALATWLWPFLLGALVAAFLVAKLILFMKHRCGGKCRWTGTCTLPRWECSCPRIQRPTCPGWKWTCPKFLRLPALACPKMPQVPQVPWPRISCPRIYLPLLPLFSRKKAKVLDESMSDARTAKQWWSPVRRRWWQRRSSANADLKSSEGARHEESARPKMSRRKSWSDLAHRVESRRPGAKTDNADGEEEVWFVPIPKDLDEESAVIDNGAEEIMDISIPKGYQGNAAASATTGGGGSNREPKRKKKKKKNNNAQTEDDTEDPK